LSSLDVLMGSSRVVVTLSLAAADAEIVGGRASLGSTALEAIGVEVEGAALRGSIEGISLDEGNTLHVRLVYDGPDGAQVVVRSSMPAKLGPGHKELATVRARDGSVLATRMLDATLNEIAASIGDARPGSNAARFVALGIEHILTGYDHLLFLAGVLVVARRWRDVVQTVTAFTVAHSMTLALAAVGVLAVPSSIVEPLIAASVVYVGLENLFQPIPGSRWKLTFAFGLVHGLGFGAILSDLGIGTAGTSLLVPLAAFNAGVELGQIAVAGTLVPVFWALNAQAHARLRFAAVWSLLVATAGGYWLVERIL
jgi:hydrogenase/urease accessory protein HupE